MIEHLQINDVAPCVHYDSDGVQAAFTFPFAVFKAADLEVWVDKTRVAAGITVSGVGISLGGAVLFGVPPAAGRRVTLRRRMALERTSDFQTDGIIRAKTLNDELDYQVAAVQQVADDVSRCLQRPFTSGSTADLSLPDPAPGKALGWSADGTGLVNDPADFAAVVEAVSGHYAAARTQADAAAAAAASAQAAGAAAQAAARTAQLAAGGVRASATDTSPRSLAETLVAGAHVDLTVVDSGGDETLRLDVAGLGVLAARDTVTASEIEGLPPSTILGRAVPGIGPAAPLALGNGLSLAGGVLSCTNLVDFPARDQLALVNLRLLLNSAVSSGALMQGFQWDLASDEWSASSNGQVYNPAGYYTNVSDLLASYASPGGTGNRSAIITVSSSGIGWGAGCSGAPLVDGTLANTNWCYGDSAAGDWLLFTFDSARYFDEIRFHGGWYVAAVGVGHTSVMKVQGSNDGSTFTDIGTETAQVYDGIVNYKTYTIDPAFKGAAYKFLRLYGVSGAWDSGGRHLLEVEFKLTAQRYRVSVMTLTHPTAVNVSTPPATIDAYFLYKDDSGTAALGTDVSVDLSRDNGTTWTPATLSLAAAYDGAFSVVKARADVSAQPLGTAMKLRIKALSDKIVRVAAPALYKE